MNHENLSLFSDMSHNGDFAQPERPDDDKEFDPDDVDPGPGPIEHPFDPNEIRVEQRSMTIYNLVQRMDHSEIDLAPDFQRKAGIWDAKRQSRLIESLLIRIPLPALYMDEQGIEKYAVVDGVQRLTAIHRFLSPKADSPLVLTGLEFLTDAEGKRFSELPGVYQRRINEATLVAHVILKGTPSTAKLNIFKRINTGGMTLSAQEIRHAMNPGSAREFLRCLADTAQFKQATGHSVRDDRMDDRECALRFLAFRDWGWKTYVQNRTKDLDGFLNKGMETLNSMTDQQRSGLEQRFCDALDWAHSLFGNFAFRKPRTNSERGPVNKALFESTLVALDQRLDDLTQVPAQNRATAKEQYLELFNDNEFYRAVSTATANDSAVKKRFETMIGFIDKLLKP